MGYQSEQELMRDVRDLERKVKAARLRAGELEDEVRDYRSCAISLLTRPQIEEAPSFPLLDIPDAELDPEQLKEKKRQRMLKAGYETRVKLKAEKQAERERLVRESRGGLSSC